MERVKEVQFVDILKELPEIVSLKCEKDFAKQEYDIFLCALGFEDRCLTIPEQLSKTKDFKCQQVLYFEYSTNLQDNEVNKSSLIRAFQKFSSSYKSIQCDEDHFTKNLREYFEQFIQSHSKLGVIFDISSCSSKLILSVMKVLLELNINLLIVYSEANIYHPTNDEFEKKVKKKIGDEHFGIAQGVEKVIPSSDYPGTSKESSNIIVAFLTFKPERTNAIITDIDETLMIRPDKRIIWIIGDPHMDGESKNNRKEMMKKINKIPKDGQVVEVSTFNYQDTLKRLDKIYGEYGLIYHLNISALGSKMQSVGIAIFCYVRPDVSVYLAIPKEYKAKQYSEGTKATWQVNFGEMDSIRNILNRVDQLENI